MTTKLRQVILLIRIFWPIKLKIQTLPNLTINFKFSQIIANVNVRIICRIWAFSKTTLQPKWLQYFSISFDILAFLNYQTM